jgi:hypothetical protein
MPCAGLLFYLSSVDAAIRLVNTATLLARLDRPHLPEGMSMLFHEPAVTTSWNNARPHARRISP